MRRLDGPRYVIRAPDEQTEASLAFQEYARVVEYALRMREPGLERVGITDPADFALLMQARVVDLGSGMESYPVYGHYYGPGFGPCGPAYYHAYGPVGTEVRTVHLGYDHVLFLTAYIQAPGAPAGRVVLWEGMSGTIEDQADLDRAMPYLALGLTLYYGQATDGTRTPRYSQLHDEAKELRLWLRTGNRPVRPADSQPHE
jgi:hypothetical protein